MAEFLETDHVLVWVSDMARAISFYTDVLGLKVASSSPHFSVVTGGCFSISLHNKSDTKGPVKAGGPIIVFFASDLAEVYRRLQSKNVDIVTPPREEAPGVSIIEFNDTEGNLLSVSTQHL